MKDRKQNDVVVMDFAKAFNKVSHTRLLHKLHVYGIDPEPCGWSRSFLWSRTQHVVVHVDSDVSEEVEITSGVSQSSVPGPIFFLNYINDMAGYSKQSSVRLFADNTTIYLTITKDNDCEKLQEDLQALERWEAN